jgi:hypothetical protein
MLILLNVDLSRIKNNVPVLIFSQFYHMLRE